MVDMMMPNRQNNRNSYILVKKSGKKVLNPEIEGLEVVFPYSGAWGNTCILHEPLPKFVNCRIHFVGNNGLVSMGKVSGHSMHTSNLSVRIETNNKLLIGNDFSCNGAQINIDVEPDTAVRIGNDVMISYGVQMRTSDAHAVVDLDGNPLNFAKDIIIGNHVWIAQNAFLAKGSIIPDNSIVGAASFVNKAFKQKGIIIAGTPACIKKKNINWLRDPASTAFKIRQK